MRGGPCTTLRVVPLPRRHRASCRTPYGGMGGRRRSRPQSSPMKWGRGTARKAVEGWRRQSAWQLPIPGKLPRGAWERLRPTDLVAQGPRASAASRSMFQLSPPSVRAGASFETRLRRSSGRGGWELPRISNSPRPTANAIRGWPLARIALPVVLFIRGGLKSSWPSPDLVLDLIRALCGTRPAMTAEADPSTATAIRA
jgi:hypothetical protein